LPRADHTGETLKPPGEIGPQGQPENTEEHFRGGVSKKCEIPPGKKDHHII